MTTGLQSIILSGNEVECIFLLGSRADGCLLEWFPLDGGTLHDKVILNRNRGNKTSVELPLFPGTYKIFGYGLLRNVMLHDFPVELQGILIVTSTGTYVCGMHKA